MIRQSKQLFAICLTANLLGGCNMELPMIGNVQDRMEEALETLEEVATPLKSVIRPIKQHFFPRKASRNHSGTARSRAMNTDEETDRADQVVLATPTPLPTPSDSAHQQQIKQNMTFDHWRTLGIQRIYEAQTQEAIACFKKALAIRPNDSFVLDWLFAAENPIQGAQNQSTLKTTQPQALPSLPQ